MEKFSHFYHVFSVLCGPFFWQQQSQPCVKWVKTCFFRMVNNGTNTSKTTNANLSKSCCVIHFPPTNAYAIRSVANTAVFIASFSLCIFSKSLMPKQGLCKLLVNLALRVFWEAGCSEGREHSGWVQMLKCSEETAPFVLCEHRPQALIYHGQCKAQC